MFRGQDAAREERSRATSKRTPLPGQPSFMAAPLKNADYVDLRTPISTYVSSTYAYRASQDSEVAQRLGDVQELRRSILSAADKPDQLRGLLAK